MLLLGVWLGCRALAWHVQSPRLNLNGGGGGDGEGDAGRRVSANRMAYAVILDFGPQTVEESLLNIDEASPTPSPRRLQLLQNGCGGGGRSQSKEGYQWRLC